MPGATSAPGDLADQPRTQLAEFVRFARIVQIGAVAFGVTLLLSSALLGHAVDLGLGLVNLALAAWFVVVIRHATHHGVRSAMPLAAAGILTDVALGALVVPHHPLLTLVPLLAVVVAIPHLDPRAIRWLAVAAAAEVILIVVRARLVSPADVAETFASHPLVEVIFVAVAVGLGLMLVLQSARRMNAMLERSRAAEQTARDARAALESQHALLRIVIESTTDHIYLKDRDGRYLLLNEAARRWLDLPVERVIGYSGDDFYDPETAREVRRYDERVLASEQPITYEEVATRSGVTQTFLTTLEVYRDGDGQVAGVVGISRDITEHKQTEEQLRQAQKMEAVGRLAGAVAHDFNNLLTAITGYSSLALDGVEPDSSVAADIGEVKLAAARATALTKQLLAFSRRQVLQPEVLDPNVIVAGIEPMLRRLIPETIEVRVVADPDLGHVRVDPHQLEQVVLNLALNARDAMPAGGILTIATSNVELDAEERSRSSGIPPSPYVLLAVSDTGVGMDAGTLPQIFEPFFSTKAPGEGSGLGLATVYGTVKQSGGRVSVTSEPGRGSTFRVYLPRVDAPLTQREARRRAERGRWTGGTVLVVEDEPALRNLVQNVLRGAGFEPLLAADGTEALELLRNTTAPLDLLLTDIVMPGMSGPALAAAVRARQPDVPVLLMSGYPRDALGPDAILDATWTFIAKPFTPDELLVTIEEAVAAAPARGRTGGVAVASGVGQRGPKRELVAL